MTRTRWCFFFFSCRCAVRCSGQNKRFEALCLTYLKTTTTKIETFSKQNQLYFSIRSTISAVMGENTCRPYASVVTPVNQQIKDSMKMQLFSNSTEGDLSCYLQRFLNIFFFALLNNVFRGLHNYFGWLDRLSCPISIPQLGVSGHTNIDRLSLPAAVSLAIVSLFTTRHVKLG